jgi:LPXTG-motif cell wall-anchored protein
MAVGPHGQKAVYDADTERHDWALGDSADEAAPELGRSAAMQLGASAGIALAAGAAGIILVRRRKRRAER